MEENMGNDIEKFFILDSDSRLKENIEDIDPVQSVLILDKIQVKSFNLIGQGKKIVGFVAEDIQPILPEAIHVSAGGLGSRSHLMVDYSTIFSHTVNAFKLHSKYMKEIEESFTKYNNKMNELISRFNELNDKVDRLEDKINKINASKINEEE